MNGRSRLEITNWNSASSGRGGGTRGEGRGKLETTAVGMASLVAQLVKNPPAMRETWVQSLGWEDPLEKGKAAHSSTHSSIVAERNPWTVHGVAKSRTQLSDFHSLHCSLVDKSLSKLPEIVKNREAWCAGAHGVAKSYTTEQLNWTDCSLKDKSLSKLPELVKNREGWCAGILGVAKSWTWLSNWTTVVHVTKVQVLCPGPSGGRWKQELKSLRRKGLHSPLL